jgi:hypothetical protein
VNQSQKKRVAAVREGTLRQVNFADLHIVAKRLSRNVSNVLKMRFFLEKTRK